MNKNSHLDFNLMRRWIPNGARVLDLGCGDGDLLLDLKKHHTADGIGVEIDPDKITHCLEAGLQVIEYDIDTGLKRLGKHSFDTVIMTYSLQELKLPGQMLEEILHVGREGIVYFDNMAHWRQRLRLALGGKVPSPRMQQENARWYDQPSAHLRTTRDFEELCRRKNIRILDQVFFGERRRLTAATRRWADFFATAAAYKIAR